MMPLHMAPTHAAHFIILPVKCLYSMQTYVGSSALGQLAEQPVPTGQNWALNVTVFLQPDTMSQVQSLSSAFRPLLFRAAAHTMRMFHDFLTWGARVLCSRGRPWHPQGGRQYRIAVFCHLS